MRFLMVAWIGLMVLPFLASHAAAQPMQCDCGDLGEDSPARAFGTAVGNVAASPVTWSVAGIGFLAVGVWGWRAGWLPRAAGALALWSRFDADELDEHPTRSRILDLLRTHPGVGTPDLAELTELNHGTLLYHLEILARFGLVNSQRVGRERAWYVTKSPKPDLDRLAILAAPARKQLFHLIEASPGATQAELARTLGLSPATIHHHLRTLAEAGLVELRRDGARVRCFPIGAAPPNFGAAVMTSQPAAPAG